MTLFAWISSVSAVIGCASAAACVLAVIGNHATSAFFNAYLYAYLFWLGVSLGSLSLIMLHNLTGGEWGCVVRRIAEPAARQLPLMAILFIPILFGMQDLFPWSRSAEVAASETLRHRTGYLNIPFFIARASIYFSVWIIVAWKVRSLGKEAIAQSGGSARARLRGWSAAGLILYLMTMTHAGYDWAMSRDTDFYSTAFGFIITVGQTLSALAFIVLVVWSLNKTRWQSLTSKLYKRPEQNPPEFGAPNILNDVGNILLTLVILWAYVSFMQFLVIWMGNSGEDNGYYLKRGMGQENAWRWIGLTLITMHFFIPFILLLFRATKKYLPALTSVSLVIFIAHLVEQYWLIAPSPDLMGPRFAPSWFDCVMPCAIGGIWLAGFVMLLSSSLASLESPLAVCSVRIVEASIEEGLHHV